MSRNILIVDDEIEILDLIELYLKAESFNVYKFINGKDALQSLTERQYDLAILDVMLPDISGFDICAKIRDEYHFPIIMLTAKVTDMDKITGLTLGADDYLTKPFNPLELVARVKAQLRRVTQYNQGSQSQSQVIDFSGIVINKQTHECFLNEKEVALTPTEFEILWLLCENRGEVISSERLFKEIWGDKYFKNENNTVMVHIRRLREKLQEPPGNPKFIKTVWGVGYKVEK
ncbi:VanR-ABDEGLN family response regulator transcription factor [Turicibacter sanguinis]|uniref:VanR-ABDEGLN family DNA-binding response regulator n=1 Tax=Turicibacter sanguinis TaxID=154288 RepID=A0A6G2CBQ4_9FIRM|nr:VanR-ABDEGLN family response regulator transcription factor [Turicibacter sanguinis]MDB8543801.1 VanR-ABDEGLN family response regulator transcription factor [Turicibacter sanguinis]MTK68977.1 VanR-ABDEGLN family DNA-binding response regulator [Turicibacter sanguinis]MTK80679.1 VanR-ABDEGLN family DNA-binding response regulator [Turicibacter sanguinis]MTK82409.1 VanR-ABDEGLN family DNA-binding response regulator [Turicibacter sanguinis]MTK85109.1 VanR-ABDEGLN family DNA-binding response regu